MSSTVECGLEKKVRIAQKAITLTWGEIRRLDQRSSVKMKRKNLDT